MKQKVKPAKESFGTPEWWKRFFKEWVLTLGVAFLIAFLFRTTIASPRHIPTGSMIPTIKIGEFIFVHMFAYDWHIPFTRTAWVKRKDPARGDVAVFEYPEDPSKDYIKRVIAVPGDIVEIRNKRIILNGSPVPLERVEDERLLRDLTPKYEPSRMSLFRESLDDQEYWVVHMNDRPSRDMPPVTVPSGYFFVMGDNRDDSQDSRYWGFVSRDKFLGKGSFIWFSFNRHHPPFVRGTRLFTRVR